MINVNKEYVGEIPLLHVVQQEKSDKALPFIIFLHGYTSAKEHNLHFAFLLAEKGFRVVLPDAPFHGERAKKEAAVLDPLFWEIVIHGVDELDVIRQHYLRSGLIDPFYIGVAGTSMGAIMTYGGLSQY